MRTIGVVTVARSDYGMYLPVLRRIQADPDLRLHLIVAGMHLAPVFGSTVREIEADGFAIAERVDLLLVSDAPEGIAKSMGLGTIGFAQAYARCRPDILLVLGDRFEMHAAVVAALPFTIPVAHLHGGETTEGAIDEALRHAITKMSHIHFVATERYARRVMQLGEEPWRVVVSGAPSLDNMSGLHLCSRDELTTQCGLDMSAPFLLVTYHPVTLEYEQTARQMCELLAALEEVDVPVLCTYPNADTHSQVIIQMLQAFAARYRQAQVVVHLGTRAYFSAMHYGSAMVGNSSSGIIEAASFKLPVVNIGTRQQGRVRGKNVIDVSYTRQEIVAAIKTAMSWSFRESLSDLVNPYGDGHAAERIVNTLKQVPLNAVLLHKRFLRALSRAGDKGRITHVV
jgi:UDP-hydrolysing UDP-N-acetyl-D-glucosamine 2-epimerase